LLPTDWFSFAIGMIENSSAGRAKIPREGVESGLSTGNSFFLRLWKDASGVLVLAPQSQWKVAIWPVGIGLLAYLIEPLRRVLWTILFSGDSMFDDPFFSGFIQGMFLWMGLVFGAMLYIFYSIVRGWTPTTCFDHGRNLILRGALDSKLFGVRWRVEELRMKLTDAQAVQLCYGGFEPGDSESAGYKWWQLLIVGRGEPPFRAIIAQSAAREKLTVVGREIAAYLSVPWVDDGDFRSSDVEGGGGKMTGGRLESDGTFVTTGSSTDSLIEAEAVLEYYKNRNRPRHRIFNLVFFGLFVAMGLFIWRVSIQESDDLEARDRQREWRASGPALDIPLAELLANGSIYHGKKIKTTGYVRYVTLIMGRAEDKHRTLYALSPEAIDLSQRKKGGTIGDTAVTNLMIHTKEWVDSFSRGAETNTTPKRTVVGAFHFDGKYHNLSLLAWTPATDR
jgi:hypothetical protein